ncbi:MAG: hypothetical protein KDB27_34815, partial [Planctomycetales bacterium]|nr:hypothetical protein [Planctomycetales bacterium]
MRRPHILASSLSLVAFVAGANGEISSAIPGGGVSLVGYSAATGEVWLDDWACTTNPRNTPSSEGMTSAHIVSQSGVFSESQN